MVVFAGLHGSVWAKVPKRIQLRHPGVGLEGPSMSSLHPQTWLISSLGLLYDMI